MVTPSMTGRVMHGNGLMQPKYGPYWRTKKEIQSLYSSIGLKFTSFQHESHLTVHHLNFLWNPWVLFHELLALFVCRG